MLGGTFNDYTTSKDAPLGIRISPEIISAYQEIKTYEESARSLERGQNRSCQGGFIYGGVFTSLHKGETPRDVDMVVHAPEMVALAKLLDKLRNTEAASYSERRELDEDKAAIVSMMFPYSDKLFFNEEIMEGLRETPALGSCFQITAAYHGEDGIVPLDILFVEQPIQPYQMFTAKPDAPIRQAAYDLEAEEFVYHRHFPDHTERWIFEPTDPATISRDGLSRAEEKGMEIIMPESS